MRYWGNLGLSWPVAVWYFQGLLTPVIAIVAGFIAYQQWRTNRLKVRLEVFDRRYRVFEEVRTVLSLVTRDGNIEIRDLVKFRSETVVAHFLFKSEVEAYIDEMYQRGIKLQSATARKDAHESDLQLKWFTKQYDVVKAKFKNYLDVGKL